MSRAPSRSGPLVAVSIDGKGAAWCDGTFQGDRDIVAYAKRAALLELPIEIHDTEVLANGDSPLGALAALAAYSPGRARIAQAPAIVIDAIYPSQPEDPAATWGTPDPDEGMS